MSHATRESILEALGKVSDPKSGRDVVSAGLISGIVVRGHDVGFLITIEPSEQAAGEALRLHCEAAVLKLPHVDKVTAVLTAEATPGAAQPATLPGSRPTVNWNRNPVEGVRHLLAVASGKGGVGKSTMTVCLALALQERGLKVGILDADIYGPSIPLMMGLEGQPDVVDNKMVPLEKSGIKCMSIGFLLGDDAAIMRGPMVTKALNQMLRQSVWATADVPLDVLLIDMPPGTGDIHLSLVQQSPVSGAVVVTTPQKAATIDARKGVEMFRKVNVPVFGIIENMSYMEDLVSGHISHPFGQGGGEKMAKEMSTLFLGKIPLEPTLGAAVDVGALSAAPAIFSEIAEQLCFQMDVKQAAAS